MQPTKNRVLVRVYKEKVKKGQEPSGSSVMRAYVLKVGPEVKGVKVKDQVVFAPYGVDEVIIDDEKLLVVTEDLILGIYEQKSNTKTKG